MYTKLHMIFIMFLLAVVTSLPVTFALAEDINRLEIGPVRSTRQPGSLQPQAGEGGTIEFGNWNPGQITDADVSTTAVDPFPNVKDSGGNYVGLRVAFFTNRGPWNVQVRLLAPLSSGSNTIPVEAPSLVGPNDNKGGTLRWFGFAVPPEASGTFTNANNGVAFGQTYSYMTTSNFVCYVSGPGENNNFPNGTIMHFGFFILVPPDQRPGAYSGEVMFTAAER